MVHDIQALEDSAVYETQDANSCFVLNWPRFLLKYARGFGLSMAVSMDQLPFPPYLCVCVCAIYVRISNVGTTQRIASLRGLG
jgi:hypothetical protein